MLSKHNAEIRKLIAIKVLIPEEASGEGFLSRDAEGGGRGLRLGPSNHFCRHSPGRSGGGAKHSPTGDGGHGWAAERRGVRTPKRNGREMALFRTAPRVLGSGLWGFKPEKPSHP